MLKSVKDKKYEAEFIERTRQARAEAGLTQQNVSDVLGIEQHMYQKYESRTPLPHRMIPRFCRLCRVSPSWLFYGGHKKMVPPSVLDPETE